MDAIAEATAKSRQNVDWILQDTSSESPQGATLGPTFRDFLYSAMRTRQEAIDSFAAGDMDGGNQRATWLRNKVNDPEIARRLANVANAQIPGGSEAAQLFVSGAWSAEVTNARMAGRPKSENYLKATLGEKPGGLKYAVENGTADAAMRNEYFRTVATARAAATPIRQTDPTTGRSVVVGMNPNLPVAEAVTDGTTVTLEGLGLHRTAGGKEGGELNPQWNTFADTTQQTMEAIHGVYGDLFDVGRAKLVETAKGWAGNTNDPATKIAAINSMAPPLKTIAGEVAKDPNLRETAVKFLEGLPRDLTQEQFKRGVSTGWATFKKTKDDLWAVRKHRDQLVAMGALGAKNLPAEWQDVSDDDVVQYSLHGDRDPAKASPLERQLDLKKDIDKHQTRVNDLSDGWAVGLNEDGTRKVAKPYERAIARAFKAVVPSIETIKAMGRPELLQPVLQSAAGKIEEVLRDEGFSEVAIEEMKKNDGLLKLSGVVLDVRAVGAGEKPVLRGYGLRDVRRLTGFGEAVFSADTISEGLGPVDKSGRGKTDKPADPLDHDAWLYKDLEPADEALSRVDRELTGRSLSQVEASRLQQAKNSLATAKSLEGITPSSYTGEGKAAVERFNRYDDATKARYLQRLERARAEVVDKVGAAIADFEVGGKIKYTPDDGFFSWQGSRRGIRRALLDNLVLQGVPIDSRTLEGLTDGLQGASPDVARKVLADVVASQTQVGRARPAEPADKVWYYSLTGGAPSLIFYSGGDVATPPPKSLINLVRAAGGDPAAKAAARETSKAIARTQQMWGSMEAGSEAPGGTWGLDEMIRRVEAKDPQAGTLLRSRIPGMGVNNRILLGTAAQAAMTSGDPEVQTKVAAEIRRDSETAVDIEGKRQKMRLDEGRAHLDVAREQREYGQALAGAEKEGAAPAAFEYLSEVSQASFGIHPKPMDSFGASTNAPAATTNAATKAK